MLSSVLDVESVLSTFLRMDDQREGAIVLIIQLADGRLGGTSTMGTEFAGACTSSVDEGFYFLADRTTLESIATAHHSFGVATRQDGNLQRTSFHLFLVP